MADNRVQETTPCANCAGLGWYDDNDPDDDHINTVTCKECGGTGRVQQSTVSVACPRCGEPTELLCEGYCEPCFADGQQVLDEHNLSHDLWQRLTPAEREAQIRWALR